MATTLTSSYQYIGRSNAVSCKSGYNYYILLYAKTSPNTTAGTHTVTVKQVLACDKDSTFHNWNTTGFVKVAGTTAFSWSKAKVPATSWSSSASLTEGGVTYKRHTVLKEGSAVVNTGFGAAKTVNIESSWVMNDSASYNWFPYTGKYATATIGVTLSMIAGASTPTLSASTAQMGEELTITTNRLSSNFTHTLYYTFGGTKTTMATGVGGSYKWTVPDLAAKCDNATSGSCTITCDTYNGSTNIGSKTVTVTLNVPDATTPTLSASSVNMGGSVTISTASRKSSNFTHYVSYTFGGKSKVKIGTMSTSLLWEVPYSLASEIPSETSETCTINCTTYNGDAVVGTKTVTLTLNVPNNEATRPSISATISPVHSLASAFSGMYVQGKTSVKAVITASSDYSTIKTYKLVVGGISKSSTSGTITSSLVGISGSITVKCEVVDARGYTSSVEKTISVVAYTKPALAPVSGEKAVVCERCLQDGTIDPSGTHLRIRTKCNYSSVSSKNTCKIQWRYKTSSASNYPAWTTLTTANTYDAKVDGVEFDSRSSFSVEIRAIDDVGGEADAHKIIFDVPSDLVTVHMKSGGKGVGLGGYAEEENSVLINPDWNVYGRVAGLGKCKEIIPNGADFNSYVNIGEFSVPNNAAAKTMINCPTEKAGKLRVSSMIGDGRSGADGLAYTYLLQEYFTFDGYYRFYRMVSTGATANAWTYNAWWCDSRTYWQDLGLSSEVSKSTADWGIGRTPYDCAYRVVDENHVFVSFNCNFTFSGDYVRVNGTLIPEKYRPVRVAYALVPVSGRRIARIHVDQTGSVNIEWVQDLLSTTSTSSASSTYIDGYVDYWI